MWEVKDWGRRSWHVPKSDHTGQATAILSVKMDSPENDE